MGFRFTSEPPSHSLPKVSCDLNACGWSGENDDNCYYAFDKEQFAALPPSVGMRLFIWDWSDSESIVGCEAILEQARDGWRARPIDGTWFEGKPDDTFKDV
jgi:hypothetical protein